MQDSVSEIQINANDPQTNPTGRVAAFGLGFVVAWQSVRSTTPLSYDILLKTLDFTGNTINGPFSIDPTATTNQINPRLYSLPNGVFLIVWIGINTSTGKQANFFQLFDKNGNRSGSILPNEGPAFANWDQSDSFAGILSDGTFVITWNNKTTTWVQKYTSNGTKIGQPISVFGTDDTPTSPLVVGLNSDRFVVIASFGDDLVGKMFTNAGVLYRDNFAINTVSPVYSYNLKANPDGFIVVYTGLNVQTNFLSIYSQSFDYDANTLGDELMIDSPTYGDDVNPFVTILKDNCLIISFETNSSATLGNTKDIYLKKFAQNLNLITDDMKVNSDTTDEAYAARGTPFTNSGGFVLVWNQLDVNTGSYLVKVKIFTHGEDPFILIKNQLRISQGNSHVFSNFDINTLGLGTIIYTATFVSNGYFSLATSINSPIFSFTQADVDNSLLYFTHDGSKYAPSYYLQSTNQTFTSDNIKVIVTFSFLPWFVKNSIKIEQNSSIIITNSMINGEVSDNFVPYFIVYSNISCHFELTTAPKVPIYNFTLTNITNLALIFVADNSKVTPSYLLGLQDGNNQIVNKSGTITYYLALNVIRSKFTIKQGEKLLLTKNMLDVQIDQKLVARYIVERSVAGYFALKYNLDNDVKSFTNQEIYNLEVYYVQDGSLTSPDIYLHVTDGMTTTNTFYITTTFVPLYTLTTNKLEINKGETINITTLNFNGSCSEDCDLSTVIFVIDSIVHGQFLLDNQEAVVSFSLQDVFLGSITFMHDNTTSNPYYRASIGNGETQTSPLQALISFNKQNPYPIFLLNFLIIFQGDMLFLSNKYFLAYDGGINTDFIFI